MNYKVFRARHNGKENADFKLIRTNGTADYLFLHFKTPVIFELFEVIHHISPGMCILLSPGTPHSFFPDKCELIHDWMHFIPIDEQNFSKLKIDINTFFTINDMSLVTEKIKKCERELIYKEPFYEELVSDEVSSMLIQLTRLFHDGTSGYHADAFKALRLKIYQNPSRYTDTTEMAEAVGLSRSRFSVVYKKLFGVSPKNDLIHARISKAAYLLSSEAPSLMEISELCGYQSIYHFIRQFREAMGITPSKYRKNH